MSTVLPSNKIQKRKNLQLLPVNVQCDHEENLKQRENLNWTRYLCEYSFRYISRTFSRVCHLLDGSWLNLKYAITRNQVEYFLVNDGRRLPVRIWLPFFYHLTLLFSQYAKAAAHGYHIWFWAVPWQHHHNTKFLLPNIVLTITQCQMKCISEEISV